MLKLNSALTPDYDIAIVGAGFYRADSPAPPLPMDVGASSCSMRILPDDRNSAVN